MHGKDIASLEKRVNRLEMAMYDVLNHMINGNGDKALIEAQKSLINNIKAEPAATDPAELVVRVKEGEVARLVQKAIHDKPQAYRQK